MIRGSELTPPEWKAANEKAWIQVQESGTAKPWEKELFRKDGSRVQVLMNVAALDESSVVSIVSDLTEKKKSESSLAKTQTQLSALWESGLVGIIIADKTGTMTDANDAFLKMIGYSRGDLTAGAIRWAQLTPRRKRPGL